MNAWRKAFEFTGLDKHDKASSVHENLKPPATRPSTEIPTRSRRILRFNLHSVRSTLAFSITLAQTVCETSVAGGRAKNLGDQEPAPPEGLCLHEANNRPYLPGSSWPTGHALSSLPPRSSTMATESQRSKKSIDGLLSKLNVAIQLLSTAKDVCGVAPAQIALGSACVLLTAIKDTMGNRQDFVRLGLSCADVCETLDRGLYGKRSDELSESVHKAIGKLTATMTEIQQNVTEKGEQNWASRFLNARNDKDAIAAWNQDFMRVLHVFNTGLAISAHVVAEGSSKKLDVQAELVSSMSQKLDVLTNQEGPHRRNSTQASISPGESPPPAPKDFFGRNDLIEEIVGRAEEMGSIALIGAGGIGKTAIALAVLHDDRIKHRFGDNRRFIRCDKFSASYASFLAQLSKVVGSGIKNPDDLAPLRPILSSKPMILFLDNAESILDPRGTEAQDIYNVVEELSQFSNISLGITSRISTIPTQCKRLEIPTLSMEAACDIFYSTYGSDKRSEVIDDLLRRLDFHTLSIKLLATAASHNMWDHDRLAREWDARRAQVLRTNFNESLAATIDLSLASPTFHHLDSKARELLGVVAFFPQGIAESNLEWLFPTISNRTDIFDTFCILSLTSRSSGFVTMLAPIRDYLLPQHPKLSPLLCAARDCYFTRLSVDVHPEKPRFGEARWITSEDVNAEHLLDVFTSIDANSDDVWDVCFHFVEHLVWLKPRRTVLGLKVEALPDDHCSKPKCLFQLARLFEYVGDYAEENRLLTHTLTLERRRGDDCKVAETLKFLCEANRMQGHRGEAIQHVKEAIEINERLRDTIGQANCWNDLAFALFDDRQVDAAEDAAFRAINLVSEKAQESLVCNSHQLLGMVYNSKGEVEKAIHHFETGLEIASSFNRHDYLFWLHYGLVDTFYTHRRYDEANTRIEQLKFRAADNLYYLGRAVNMQAWIWYRQGRPEEAEPEALRALEAYENVGAANDAEFCRSLLQSIGTAWK
ncbi:hypothetical protein BJ322DRAFT_1208324 [Thelephora terrestris]|uniref:AAA+ ATPase domain-containing protein n=1 Tax=Thelephora terrestris TaxID=56493 RepID=A0A9P6HN34_9AGAM|nr:hypothetical protein BJ322DRAFT_1208324 [Thelephora terrestris]